VIVLLGLGAAFCLLAAHPFVTYPLSLLMLRRAERPAAQLTPDGEWRPSIAICMSAFNEEGVIVAKMQSLLEIARRYGNVTIHVYADAPSDGTVELLRPFADRVDLVISEVRTGKTFGMNQLVARSDSEILLFTDANVTHDPDILDKIVAPLIDPSIGCASAHLIYSNSKESATAATGAVYWAIEERIKRIESDSFGLVGVDGAMFAMRRSLHRPPPPRLIDDLYLSLLVLIRGARVVSQPEATVYERSAVLSVEESARKRRIACQAMNVHRELWPELRRMPALRLYGYVSHRLIKWMTPFLILCAGLCFLAAAVVGFGAGLTLAAVAAGAIALWLGARLRFRPALIVTTALASLYGVAAGVFDSIFLGKTYTVWDPALSVRAEDDRGAGADPPRDVR
jgi:cellulose synthase/poly-beta-1,6-N-acetylglucosamine synthase-like glycosyltransferase